MVRNKPTVGAAGSSTPYFQVTSHGRTATYWLTAALNARPDILRSYGSYLPPVLEYFDRPKETTTLNAHDDHQAFISRSFNEVLDELVRAGDARCYGMVHAHATHHLVSWPQLADPVTPPNVINLVRHPSPGSSPSSGS